MAVWGISILDLPNKRFVGIVHTCFGDNSEDDSAHI